MHEFRITSWAGLVCTFVALSSGCAPSAEELGSSRAALTYGGDDCSADTMYAAAPAERRAVVARAAQWVLSPVEYSQSNYQDGYRCDCSGYVSMAWDNGESFTTHDLPPRTSDTSLAYSIRCDELLPGDALNSEGHMRFYAGLSASGDLCIWEQAHSGTSTMSHAISAQTLYDSGYEPVRSTRLFGGSSGPSNALWW